MSENKKPTLSSKPGFGFTPESSLSSQRHVASGYGAHSHRPSNLTAKDIAQSALRRIQEQLQEVKATNPLQKYLSAHKVIYRIFSEMNHYVDQYGFTSRPEEIAYFKYQKPAIWSELIYYTERYILETRKPFGAKEKLTDYYNNALQLYQHHFERHQEFYNYIRTEAVHMDAFYFTREANQDVLPPEDILDSGKEIHIGSVHCYRLAKFQALERLSDELRLEIEHLDRPSLAGKSSGLNWTDKNVHLIELAYALQAKGAVNNGNSDLKTIIQGLETLFQTSVGNYYGVYNQNIRLRKRAERTDYLRQLILALEKRMDDTDEDPRYR
ncbi:RteC protein [Arachidicoccus rhizosphaerae]|uniref:RteC protein n=1 Tax=Arachidicoccus rhizosphaerae TaxID=551991 RepID=A0A1H4AA30_9BACT|nr:RteC domain-containing protein [Arachidicoccus rhizosphaerae]SEA32973.1 RteC protein [Arachidicoccus rhizosphaerae]